MKRTRFFELAPRLIQLLLAAAVFLTLLFAIAGVKRDEGAHGREQLERAVRRSALTCYTIEGVYPPSVEYLEERYGLQIDRDRYVVFYSVFAENLMPDISVLEKDV